VLGRESDGNPAFTQAAYGKGKVIFLSFGMEIELANTPGAFADDALPFRRIYRYLADQAPARRILTGSSPFVGITEHRLSTTRRVAVLINYSPNAITCDLALAPLWQMKSVLYGPCPRKAGRILTVALKANDAGVLVFQRS
jgi:hypothetical protein